MNDIILKITGLHPKVADAVSQTLNEAKSRGLSVGLFAGLRTAEDQDKLYSLGRSVKNPDGTSKDKPMGNIITNAKGWQSWHNFGLAADLIFKDSKMGWTWNKTPEQWEELGKIGEMFNLEWGGRWKFTDYPHFQMRGLIQGIDHAKEILEKSGLDVLWSMV